MPAGKGLKGGVVSPQQLATEEQASPQGEYLPPPPPLVDRRNQERNTTFPSLVLEGKSYKQPQLFAPVTLEPVVLFQGPEAAPEPTAGPAAATSQGKSLKMENYGPAAVLPQGEFLQVEPVSCLRL